MQVRTKINEKLKSVEQMQITIGVQLDKSFEKFKKKKNKNKNKNKNKKSAKKNKNMIKLGNQSDQEEPEASQINEETPEEIEQKKFTNKFDRLEKAKENIDCLKKAFEQQNKMVTAVLRSQGIDDQGKADIENHKVFKERKPLTKEQQEQLDLDEREMNEEEKQLLKQFDQNDQEIDQMLEVVINQLDKLKFSA